ncbi:MAG: hypothetical protein PHU32_06260 [Candidatus ainarchaeum sp.]|nr:hypothetical protein [Candidatus ainarchaeum sp.]
MTSIENLRRIDYFVPRIASEFREESPQEIARALDEIKKRVLKQNFHTKEELNILAEKQLETLSKKLSRLVRLKKIEKDSTEKILSDLKKDKEKALRRATETPIRNNSDAKCLPIMPVIGTNALDVSLLMELIEGENLVPLGKIKSNYPYGLPKKSYWVIDTRINEFNGNFSPVLIEEAIAYCMHSNILSRHRVLLTRSRYWHAMNEWQFMITLINGKPTLCETSAYECERTECTPICSFQLIF